MKTVSEYCASIPESRKSRVENFFEAISSAYPDVEISMRYKMPTFDYRGAWVAIANQKHYVSFYTCSAEHISEFKSKYPKIKTGKGCINFKDCDEFEMSDLSQVIRHVFESQGHS